MKQTEAACSKESTEGLPDGFLMGAVERTMLSAAGSFISAALGMYQNSKGKSNNTE